VRVASEQPDREGLFASAARPAAATSAEGYCTSSSCAIPPSVHQVEDGVAVGGVVCF
jgi:hypothetical protein